MKEIPITFKSKGQQIIGLLHLPNRKNAPVIIMHHGWSGSKIGPFRLFVYAAREFARNGFAVLRYDARGSGDSEGIFENQTIKSQIEDLEAAIGNVHNFHVDNKKIGIIGHSQGGKIAILCAARDRRIKCIDSWAGATKSKDFYSEIYMRDLHDKGYWYIPQHGVKQIKKKVIENVKYEEKYNVVKEIKKLRIPIQITSGTNDDSVPFYTAKLLYKNANKPKKLNVIKGADHLFNPESHKNLLIKSSMSWFKRWLK